MATIITKVIHSESKSAWNIVGTRMGDKHKIARVPYYTAPDDAELTRRNKEEAYEHAAFISQSFNRLERSTQTVVSIDRGTSGSKWNKSYLEYCEIMHMSPTMRDQILFMAGYTFHSLESLGAE